jgi:hypothetical protein
MGKRKNYIVYFDLFDKTIRAKVIAENEDHAKRLVCESIIKKVKFTEIQNADLGSAMFDSLFGFIK